MTVDVSRRRAGAAGTQGDAAAVMAAAEQVAEEAFGVYVPEADLWQVSQRWGELTGMLGPRVPHAQIRERVHPDDRDHAQAQLRHAVLSHSPSCGFDLRLRHEDGAWRWLRFRFAFHFGTEGRVSRLLAAARDVTEEHRVQDLFEGLVRHNALILNSAGEGFASLDVSGRILFVNPAAATMLGGTVAEMAGLSFCQSVVGCLGEAAGEHAPGCPVRGVLADGDRVHEMHGEFRRRDGSAFPVEYVATPWHERGATKGVILVFSDISERRRAEDAARRARRFSEGLIKSSVDGIIAFDRDLRVTLWNPAMERLTGRASRDMVGLPIRDCLPFLAEPGQMDALQGTLQGRETLMRDRPFYIEATRQELTVEARYSALFDPDDLIIGGLAILRDRTQEKRHEQEVKQAREFLVKNEKLAALGTLVSGVAHELRTPMSYINNHLYLIRMVAERMTREDPTMEPLAAELMKRSDASMKGIQRMAKLLDDLRATYRPHDGEVKRVDPSELIDEAVRVFKGAYEGPVQVRAALSPTPRVMAEPGRLQQVIINLLNNAAEAMPEGGRVDVRLEAAERGFVLEVSDDGPGIPEAVRAEMFKPFFTTKNAGSGLGLYLVRQIVERHAGHIECESEPSRGTTFRIWIPGVPPEHPPRLAEVTGAQRAPAGE